MEYNDLEAVIEGILFASGEPVSISRLSAVLNVDADEITAASDSMADRYAFDRRGIRLVKLDDAIQLCSAPEYADTIRLALETRKQPQLTQPALEALAIIAYFQPITRAYIEKVRGVDSSYTVNLLCERGLVEPCGKLSVPGNPTIFRTTKNFLRVFGIESLSELPELPDVEEGDAQKSIRNAIEALAAQGEVKAE